MLAVIGAGASGTLTAVHLLRASRGDWRVVLIDREDHGSGAAYSTRDPRHLLNVPAGRMSAFDDDPGDFVRWCRAHGEDVDVCDYLPRRLYGRYLKDLLVRFASPGELELVREEAVGLDPATRARALAVTLADGRLIAADAAVVALGNPRPAPIVAATPGARIVEDPWNPAALATLRHAGRVVVVGTSLTAVDATLTITAASPQTEIVAVSRHGRLPQRHRAGPERSRPPLELGEGPVTIGLLERRLREAVGAEPSAWREIVDSLRPSTQRLWRACSLEDRRRFMRELKWLWDIHRHRMAPAIAAEIDALAAGGRLRVEAGTVTSARQDPSGVVVELQRDGHRRELAADWVVNATGPAGQLEASADPLVRHLLTEELARPDDLGIGFACHEDATLIGAGAAPIYTLGPPRRGELLESTAIPEIRSQAAAIAGELLARSGRGSGRQPALAAR